MGIEDLMTAEERDQTGVASMTERQKQALLAWGVRMHTLGASHIGEIERIKHGGHLLVLADGSRWEVEEDDAYTTESWSEGDRVVIVGSDMFRLEDCETVSVMPDE